MRILIDENAPVPVVGLLRHLLPRHEVQHVALMKWSGKKDLALLADAASRGFDALLTRDGRQLEDPDETTAIKKSGLHHVRFSQKREGLVGLGLAAGAIVAAMPIIVPELEEAGGQRLVQIRGLEPGAKQRFLLVDPAKEPPRYWPR